MAREKLTWPSPTDMGPNVLKRVFEEAENRNMSTGSYVCWALKTYWAMLEREYTWSAGHHETVSREQPNEYPVRMPSGRS